jgi:L-xylulokinase
MEKFFLSIDNGGTKTKVVLFDSRGMQKGCQAFPTECIEEQTGRREIDLDVLWQSICQAIQNVLRQSGIAAQDILGVACVGHGKGLYVLDAEQKVFRRGILSTDARAGDLADVFETRVAEVFPVSQQHVVGCQAPVLLRWLKDNLPEDYARIGTVLSAKDFVRSKLTGQVYQEYGDASGNGFLDLTTASYDLKLFRFFGIEECWECMPPLKRCEEICGAVTAAAAARTGLVAGTPVVGGLFDIDACALATGVLDERLFSITVGTWNINTYPAEQCAPFGSGLMNSLFPGGKFLLEASSPTSAGNLAKMLQMLLMPEGEKSQVKAKAVYEEMETLLEKTNASSSKVVFFPFLYGNNVNPAAEGALLGLRSDTGKQEILRAVYEGIAFAHRQHVEQLLTVLGHRPSGVRLSGGGTRSGAWMQMFADVLQIPVETVAGEELGALGGAIVAAVGTGTYRSLAEAVENMSHVSARFSPRVRQSDLYDMKYAAYADMLKVMDTAWQGLRHMQERMEEHELTGDI